jgi:NAD dependent epimerase/dehydratase
MSDSFWNGRKVLVTGAGGFIGSHLTERLVQLGADTRALVHYRGDGTWGWLERSSARSQIQVAMGDVCDRESMRELFRDVDVVFHLAALIAIPYSYRAPSSYVRTNIEGTMNVLELAREAGTRRVVHTSTSECYGTARYVPIDEEHPLQGQSPYSASKIGADKIAESYLHSFGIPVVTVRPFNTYGPRQSARAVIPTIISQAIAGGTIRLGNLHPTRDLTFVTDTAEGFIAAARSDNAIGETINLGVGNEISIGDLAQLICTLIGSSADVVGEESERVRREGSEVERLLSDNSKARTLLGWHPGTDITTGLQRTIAWIKENMSAYKPELYVV